MATKNLGQTCEEAHHEAPDHRLLFAPVALAVRATGDAFGHLRFGHTAERADNLISGRQSTTWRPGRARAGVERVLWRRRLDLT